jgi:argininosuccinate synthase
VTVVGRRSPYSLYDEGLATYSHGDTFDRSQAKGFLALYGLGLRTVAQVRRARGLEG